MTEGAHSMKLPRSWDTGSDQSGVPVFLSFSFFVAPVLLLFSLHVEQTQISSDNFRAPHCSARGQVRNAAISGFRHPLLD